MAIKGHDSALLPGHIGIGSAYPTKELPGHLIEEKLGDSAQRAAGHAAKLQTAQEAEGGNDGQR